MIQLAIVGSRTITDEEFVFEKLDFYTKNMKDITVVSGGAKGIDTIAEKWARQKDYKTEIFLPEYDKYPGKLAPIIRNKTIMENSTHCIAFIKDSSKGTLNAIENAEKLGLKIRIIEV